MPFGACRFESCPLRRLSDRKKRHEFKNYIRPGRGASDVTPFFDAQVFSSLIKELSRLIADLDFNKVVCIEGRGFIVGAPVAFLMNKGLIPVRASGKLKNDVYTEKYTDYSDNKELEILKDSLTAGEKVLLIDDWVQTGATVKSAIALIEKCGGKVAGIAAFIDDSTDLLKKELAHYNYRYMERVLPEDQF